jgi:hypothetical protein
MVGLPDTPLPSAMLKPLPEAVKVRESTEPPDLTIIPFDAVSRLPETPFKVI